MYYTVQRLARFRMDLGQYESSPMALIFASKFDIPGKILPSEDNFMCPDYIDDKRKLSNLVEKFLRRRNI